MMADLPVFPPHPQLIPPTQPLPVFMRTGHPFAFSLPPFLPMNQLDRAFLGARHQAHWNPNEENNVNLIRRQRHQEQFESLVFLETFNVLCCLIRKVDKRTLNAKSAFHFATGESPEKVGFWAETHSGSTRPRYRLVPACRSAAYSWTRKFHPVDRVPGRGALDCCGCPARSAS